MTTNTLRHAEQSHAAVELATEWSDDPFCDLTVPMD
ncbi:hypothetical protein SAMN04489806_0576 [Paramicrobacterium humi]|uniref:Uncharacterized protein n=1 Tax=Paramicrobacterium humi TaxID=640635 RepID=A0A1H4JBG6_9MICO|nr:hypothetical protein SAMN04489806_0576 [Microbacterium humi]